VQVVPAARVYKGIPVLVSRMVPLLVDADFTVAADEPALVVADVLLEAPVLPAVEDVVALLLGLEELQAARTRAATASAATAAPGRARFDRRVRAGPVRLDSAAVVTCSVMANLP
jgi:hypothetical protein